MKPTEGTILTVVREGAEFAEENADKFDDASEFFSAYIQACRESLERTPEICPFLNKPELLTRAVAALLRFWRVRNTR